MYGNTVRVNLRYKGGLLWQKTRQMVPRKQVSKKKQIR